MALIMLLLNTSFLISYLNFQRREIFCLDKNCELIASYIGMSDCHSQI